MSRWLAPLVAVLSIATACSRELSDLVPFPCAEDGTCPGGFDCAANRTCVAAASCPPSLTTCAGACTDLLTDHSNCGSCGGACDAAKICCRGGCSDLQADPANCGSCGKSCSNGVCTHGTCICSGGFTECPDGCTLLADVNHCGSCTNQCAAGAMCQNGGCVCTSMECCSGGSICCGTCCPAGNVCACQSRMNCGICRAPGIGSCPT